MQYQQYWTHQQQWPPADQNGYQWVPPVPAPAPTVDYVRPGGRAIRARWHSRRRHDERYAMGVRMGHEVASGVHIDNLAVMVAPFSSRGKRIFWYGFAVGLNRQGKVVRKDKRKPKNLAL